MTARKRYHRSDVQQNIEYELASAESDLAILNSGSGKSSCFGKQEAEQALTQSTSLVAQARDAQGAWTTQEVLIYQLLLEARRKMLLLMPVGELAARWLSMRQRLKQSYKTGDVDWTDAAIQGPIEKYFAARCSFPQENPKTGPAAAAEAPAHAAAESKGQATGVLPESEATKTAGLTPESPKPDGERDPTKAEVEAEGGAVPDAETRRQELFIRYRLKEMKAFLDGKAVDAAWAATSIRKQTYGLSLVIIALMVVLVVTIALEINHWSWTWPWLALSKPEPTPTSHSLLICVVAGAIGGCLSTLASLITEESSGPPLARVTIARPVVGTISALALWLVSVMGSGASFNVSYPLLYLMAIALGFSERLFLSSLGKVAARAESAVSSATGQSTSGKP